MKLTRRQEEFVNNLVDLSQELDGPIHYSTLAERLGVSPFTAYDMLRVLEEKGMVSSEYQVPPDKSGPGRAERLFYPTPNYATHQDRLTQRLGPESVMLSGAELKQFIVAQARRGDFPDRETAEAFLARIAPDGPDEVRYCVEVMAVMALRLRKLGDQEKLAAYFVEIVPQDGPVAPANLSLLCGLALGLLAHEETSDGDWSRMLLEHVLRCQGIIGSLDPSQSRLLADGLTAVFTPTSAPSHTV